MRAGLCKLGIALGRAIHVIDALHIDGKLPGQAQKIQRVSVRPGGKPGLGDLIVHVADADDDVVAVMRLGTDSLEVIVNHSLVGCQPVDQRERLIADQLDKQRFLLQQQRHALPIRRVDKAAYAP